MRQTTSSWEEPEDLFKKLKSDVDLKGLVGSQWVDMENRWKIFRIEKPFETQVGKQRASLADGKYSSFTRVTNYVKVEGRWSCVIKKCKQDEFGFSLISNAEHFRFLSWRRTRSKPSFKKCDTQWRAVLGSSSSRLGEGKCQFMLEEWPWWEGDRWEILQTWNL